MKKNHNHKKLAQEWFDKADNDLLYAKAGWRETKISEDTCFLCQQVVEKYLKGFLVFHDIKPQKIHNLVKLLSECVKIGEDFKQFNEECKILTNYYNPVRYPGGYFPKGYSKEEVEEAFEIAEKMIKFIQKKCGIRLLV